MTSIKPKLAWVRDALMDSGKKQNDLARAWGVDDAVVSRFIATGAPELTFDRAIILSKMIGMDMNELQLRLAEGVAPRRKMVPAPQPIRQAVETYEQPGSIEDLIDEFKRELKRRLPNAHVRVGIDYNNGTHQ